MRIGFGVPLHGSAAGPDGLIAIACQAEGLGYDSLSVWERLLAPVKPKAPYPIGAGAHPALFRSVLDPGGPDLRRGTHLARGARDERAEPPLVQPRVARATADHAGRALRRGQLWKLSNRT